MPCAPRCPRVGISICDNTRRHPRRTVLPPVLEELVGHDVTLFVATGSHRACTQGELSEMLGDEILRAVSIVQHDARRADAHRQVTVISDSGAPAALDAAFPDRDLRLTLGLIEPHFFAGFSGGPKMVAPGLASLETILDLHSTVRAGHPMATWGVAEGNPIHDAIGHVAAAAEVHLALDITQNRRQQMTGLSAGPPSVGHPQGYAAVGRTAMCLVDAPCDVVVTTNGGYPLDQNLCQTVKGMRAAAQVAKPRAPSWSPPSAPTGSPSTAAIGSCWRPIPARGSSWRPCPASRWARTGGRCRCRRRSRAKGGCCSTPRASARPRYGPAGWSRPRT